MASTLLVAELRARLRGRHAALKAMGNLYPASSTEPAWWSSEPDVICWWLYRTAAHTADTDARAVHFREGAEALVLLKVLANVDYHACVDEVCEVWSRRYFRRATVDRRRRVLGFECTVRSTDDVAPIAERVFGVQPPSDRFLDDVKWLDSVVTKKKGAFQPSTIPVRVRIRLTREDATELAYLLRQIVQAVLAQRAYATSTITAATSARFEIVEVDMNELSTPANAESLEYLARLVEHGVRVRHLPLICDHDVSTNTRLSVLTSLQKLLSAPGSRETRHAIEHVYVDENSSHLIPALFSAIQGNHSLKGVEMNATQDPRDWNDEGVPEGILALWRWTAYALFSRHAQHDVNNVVLRVDFLTTTVLEGVEQVLEADHPLAALYDGTFQADRWIEASVFHVVAPDDGASHDQGELFRTLGPILVRITGRAAGGESVWSRVLLPGCGEAWVNDADATPVAPDDGRLVTLAERPQPMRNITFEGMVSGKQHAVASFLRLIADQVTSIRVETEDTVEHEFDMTDWTLDVLRTCPNLELLKLPWCVEITRLRSLVELAEAGHFPLRCLALDYMFDLNTSDIIDFLQVLSDTSHPLTQRLEELHVSVSDPWEPVRDFEAAWLRMLQRNRRLHTISLLHQSSKHVDKHVGEVAIRTGPLSLSSRLAFLSVVRDGRRGEIDTGVIGIIFAFAAQHRLRKVNIMFD